ncbi:MAG: FAD-dependent oxidoreductase [Gammaproteobacteria bacterium]
MKRRTDVVVVGGGMVGATFATAAAQAGFDVVVLDAGTPPQAPTGDRYAPRVVALSGASRDTLMATGAWSHLEPSRVQVYERMRVWDAAGAALDDDALLFSAQDIGAADLGCIAENDAVAAAAYSAAQAQSSISWQDGARVADIAISERSARVSLEDGQSVSGALVVAADGARSASRDLLGVTVKRGDYQQHAVVTHVTMEQPHQETAWQRFLPSGPLALLPLADGRVSIVWSTDSNSAAELCALENDAFCVRLTEASGGVLGAITECSERFTFPLGWLHVERYTGERFALMGDAAHVVHPLAGLGVNLGIADAAELAAALAVASAANSDIGGANVLRPYARSRKSDNALMLESLTALNRLFGVDQFAASLVRRMGMRLVNRAAPLKRQFIKRAMGL